MDHLGVFFVSCVSHAFASVWSPAGKGLTSWLLLVMLIAFFIIFDSVLLCFILKVAFLHGNLLREAV